MGIVEVRYYYVQCDDCESDGDLPDSQSWDDVVEQALKAGFVRYTTPDDNPNFPTGWLCPECAKARREHGTD